MNLHAVNDEIKVVLVVDGDEGNSYEEVFADVNVKLFFFVADFIFVKFDEFNDMAFWRELFLEE